LRAVNLKDFEVFGGGGEGEEDEDEEEEDAVRFLSEIMCHLY